MKRKLFFFAIILGFAATRAQDRYAGDIEITPKFGYSLYFLSNANNLEFTDPFFGDFGLKANPIKEARYGLVGDYYFNQNWSLRSGLIYLTTGTSYEDWIFKVEVINNYLNIPINANWHFGDSKNWNINFGLTPGFLVKSEVESSLFSADLTDYTKPKPFHLGISYGIGYKYEASENFGLLIDFQNMIGVTNTNNNDDETNDKEYLLGGSINIGGVFLF